MLKQDILTLIKEFIKETYKYNESDNLDNDMEYIYLIETELKNNENIDLRKTYDKLLALIGMIRFKYGPESMIISTNNDLNEEINKIQINDENIVDKYSIMREKYTKYIKSITNLDFLYIQRNSSNEGLYLALESLKSLITNQEYRELLKEEQIEEILIDCIKLMNNPDSLEKIEIKYKELIQEIWKKSLTNPQGNSRFRFLFSNISGPLREHAIQMFNRIDQHSCSMISSNFIATYLGGQRRIGFIYPNDSNIIMASAYDLGSNVFGEGTRNKEKGTSLVTPIVLERVGIERAKEANEDLLSSNSYNEVTVDSKPCGIVIIGFGENDLNIDYSDAQLMASYFAIPLRIIDVMDYKETLSESDKEYIAYHCILSYMGINFEEFMELGKNNKTGEIKELINKYKEIIAKKFIELKKARTLSKETMFKELDKIIDIPKQNSIKK